MMTQRREGSLPEGWVQDHKVLAKLYIEFFVPVSMRWGPTLPSLNQNTSCSGAKRLPVFRVKLEIFSVMNLDERGAWAYLMYLTCCLTQHRHWTESGMQCSPSPYYHVQPTKLESWCPQLPVCYSTVRMNSGSLCYPSFMASVRLTWNLPALLVCSFQKLNRPRAFEVCRLAHWIPAQGILHALFV